MNITKRAKNVSPSLTLEITAKAKKMKADGIPVVSFGAGEPDFDTPKYIIDAAKVALDKGMTRYTPAAGTMELRKAIAAKLLNENGLAYEPAQIVVSNGAKHSLSNAIRAIVEEGDEVIIPAPFWLTYPELVKLSDGTPVIAYTREEDGYKLTPELLRSYITDKTKAIILNNPCNPTGVVYTKDEIIALAREIEQHEIYVISDEIYEKLTYDHEVYSIANYSEKMKDRTIVINGVSKAYAMTGWRIGYTASNLTIAKAMSNIQSHSTSNPNAIAQYATQVALGDPQGKQFISSLAGTFSHRRDIMVEVLDGMKEVSYIRPSGAFYVMVNVSGLFGKTFEGKVIDSAHSIAMIMIDKFETAVIPCESFGAPEFIRLSYAISEADIRRGLGNFERFIKSCK